MLTFIMRFLAPLLLFDIFLRRIPCAPLLPLHREMNLMAAMLLLKPGDVLVCKGDSLDSACVSMWSCSPYTHVAVIGPDLHVYDITPIENHRRMTLPTYVKTYEGHVYYRRIKKALAKDDWQEIQPRAFRATLVPLVAATLSETPVVNSVLDGLVAPTYSEKAAFCSEFVCLVMGLAQPNISHPFNFAPGGRYDDLFHNEMYFLKNK